MNHTYRLVWNQETQRYVPAPECARGKSKSKTKTGKALAPAAVLLSAAFAMPVWAQAPPANALPTGGKVTAGQATISQNGNQMTVGQGSNKAIIDWTSFNIGKNASVTFQQPNANAIALNRVTAGDASQIHGQLNANGQVWLINPNGVVFGQGSKVDVGGLVASTMNISNADFENGNYQFSRNGATGSIANHGELTAKDGGSIALLAPTVSNDGVITAQLGTVAMAAGDKITLQAGANGLLNVEIDPATLRTLIENKQLIVADGGQVIMTGKAADQLAASVVSNSGTIQANTLQEKDGQILLIADMQHGETHAAGTLQAKFIDTSAATVSIDKDLKVNTHGGEWLIDPVDIIIGSTNATVIENALGTGDVTVSTSNGHTNPGETEANNGTDAGDIHVNADISYSANKLTLNADNDIHIDARINVNGSGTLALNHGNTGATGLKVNGQVNFAQAGSGLLAVNGAGYTVIKDVAALQAINNSDKSGRYALGGDVDASGFGNFTPIGGNFGDVFDGVFDGLGHSISGLTINSNLVGVGLFGRIENAVLRNVALVGGSVTGQAEATGVGALVGGSLVWEADAGIFNVSASTAVQGARNVGGLVGSLEGGSIVDSHASGAVTGVSAPVNNLGRLGGLVGSINSASGVTLSNVYASGDVTGQDGSSDYVGGLVGLASTSYDGTLNISNGYATGNVSTAGQYAGGLIGGIQSYEGTVALHNLYASGKVEGVKGDVVGGVIGFGRGDTPIKLTNIYWDKDSTGQTESIGQPDESILNGTAAELSAATRYSHSSYAGFGTWTQASPGVWQARDADGSAQWIMVEGSTRPFLASEYSTTIRNAHQLQLTAYDLGASYRLAGDIDASATSGANASGMWSGAGFRPIGDDSTFFTGIFDGQDHTIRSLTINRGGQDYVGLFGATNSAELRNVALESGGITGRNYVGGLVGWQSSGSIIHAFASGQVSGNSEIGGLAGYSAGSITASHATGNVHAQATSDTSDNNYYAGGLVGLLTNAGTISDSYATGDVSARANDSANGFAGGLVGRSTGVIRTSYATGNATAEVRTYTGPNGEVNYAGGLVGHNSGSISDSYATGDARSVLRAYESWTLDLLGGLVGYNEGDLQQVYATGQAVGSDKPYQYRGGLVGGNSGSISHAYYATTNAAGNAINAGGTVSGSVYPNGSGGWSGNAHGTGKTRDELMHPDLYTGWDSSVWSLAQGAQAEGYEVGLPALIGVTRPQDVVRSTWFDGGWGTEDSAYGIADWGQLSNMRRLLDKHYQLNNDLDSSTSGYAQHASATANDGAGWQPVGDMINKFTGSLDGLSHTISDLVVNSNTYAGLFGVIGEGGKISNLGLVNPTVSASAKKNGSYAGALAATIGGNAQISHSYARGGSVSASTDGSADSGQFIGGQAGGLVGNAAGLVMTDSYSSTEVSSLGNGFNVTSYAGGLIGKLVSGSVDHSYADGMVSALGNGTTKIAGGLVGALSGSLIRDSYVSGNIRDSYASGNVSATGGNMNLAGGLVGNHGGGIKQSYAIGSVSATSGSYNRAGGLIGSADAGAYANDSFYATENAAGFSINNGGVATGDWTSNTHGTPKTLTDLQKLKTFADAGWSMDDIGSTGQVWRIYDGYTTPLLRSFLKAKTVTVDVTDLPTNLEYNGAVITGNLTASGYDASGIQGSLDSVLSYRTSSKNAGAYSTQDNSLQLLGSGLYSGQQGYDISYGLDAALVIQPKALVVSGTTVNGKTYDGNANAEVNLGTISGWVGEERLNIGVSGTFEDKNAGTGKHVDVAYTLSDGDNDALADNYRLTDGNSYTADIERKALTVSGITADNKTYDGSTLATVNTGGAQFDGLVDGDDLTVSASGVFDSKNAGQGKTVTLTSSYDGDDVGNYAITGQASTTADIDRKALVITARDTGKNQGDALTLDGSTGFTHDDGLVAGETVNHVLLASAGTDAGAEAGAYDITASDVSGSNGFDADNYDITYEKGTLTVAAKQGGGDSGNGDGPGNGGDSGNGDSPGNGGGSGNGDRPGNGGGSGNGDDPGNGGGSGNGDDPGNGGDSGNGDNPGNGGGSGNGDDPGNGGGSGNGDDPGNGGNDGSSGNNAVDRRMPLSGTIWLVQKQQEETFRERLRRQRALSGNLLVAGDNVPYLTLAPDFIRLQDEE